MLDCLSMLLHRWSRLSMTGGPTDQDLIDLGLTRDQAERLAHLPHSVPERMQAMAAVFGLTTDDLERNPSDWIETAEACAGCGDQCRCRKALAKDGLITPADVAFCLNTPRFVALAAAKHA